MRRSETLGKPRSGRLVGRNKQSAFAPLPLSRAVGALRTCRHAQRTLRIDPGGRNISSRLGGIRRARELAAAGIAQCPTLIATYTLTPFQKTSYSPLPYLVHQIYECL